MKRAFPRKIKPVVVQPVSSDATGNQGRQVSPEVNRRACTSAAMIGLAISMGASSLLMPRQNDGAVAAEPLATEPTAALPSTYEVATSASTPEVEPASAAFSASQSMVEHAVQEGQTLWHLSKQYGVPAHAIASANGIAPDSVLHVGQVLRIPVTHETAAIPQTQTVVATSTTVSASDAVSSQLEAVAPTTPASHDVKDLLKQKQDSALDRLKQQRDALVVGLADLKSTTEVPGTTTPAPTLATPPAEPVMAIATPAPEPPIVGLSQLESGSQPETALPEVAIPQVTPAEPFKVEAAKPAVTPKVEVATLAPTLTKPFSAFEVSAPRVYKVTKGDTLDKIARAHNVSQEQLVKANRIQDPNFILVNQVIRIPTAKVRNANADMSPKFARKVNVASTQLPSVLEREQPQVSVPNVAVPTLVAAEPDTVAALPTTPMVSAPAQQAAILPSPLRSTKVASTADTTVATAPLGTIPFSGNESEPASRFGDSSTYSPYAQNLKQEILRLREKYRNQATASVPVAQPAPTALPDVKVTAPRATALAQPVNPEFSASKYTQGLQEEIRGLQVRQKVEQSVQTRTAEPASRSGNPQLVATAPLGSDAYDPLVQPLIGQTVSPDLPPLAAADRYLPNGGSHFKGYVWPARGVLTSGYGWRWGRMHRGIDIAGPIGTPIVAAAPGVVVYAGWNSGGYGNLVEIQHPDGSVTRYAHNNRILVRNGQQVEQGEQIAEMGSTGYSTGPHSHFEVHLPGQGAVNPMAYLASR